MESGLKLKFTDRRDHDFHKTFGTATFNAADLPRSYLVDARLTMPDQNADGFYFGCTGYTQTDLCTDQDGIVYDPGELYLATPPKGRKDVGRALRDSMKVLIKRGPKTKDGSPGLKRTAYFNIRSSKILDWFDAIRVALWVTQDEKRSASIGVPWFSEFNNVRDDGILPADVTYSWKNASGHNAKIDGWTDKNSKKKIIRDGEIFLRVKPWQGENYGDRGWVYMSRPLANAIFEMYYTEAMTVSKIPSGAPIQLVELPFIENLVSFITNLISKFAGIWSTK